MGVAQVDLPVASIGAARVGPGRPLPGGRQSFARGAPSRVALRVFTSPCAPEESVSIQLSPEELQAAHRSGRLMWPVERLEAKALEIRRDIITILAKSQTGHSGGPLSCADFGTVLFFHELNVDPTNPKWDQRDYWHFSI